MTFGNDNQGTGSRERLVVIGNGMAGCRAVEEILARDPARYAIAIFGAEPRVNYNRIMLSPVLAGEKAFDDIVINGAEWYEENDIELIAGDPVTHIDRATQTVISQAGRVEPYDRLLIATGPIARCWSWRGTMVADQLLQAEKPTPRLLFEIRIVGRSPLNFWSL